MNMTLSILFLLLLAAVCCNYRRRKNAETMRLLKKQIEGDFRVMKGQVNPIEAYYKVLWGFDR